MGVHILLYDLDGRDLLAWDSMRHSGDREIARLITELPCTFADYPDIRIRPADFAAWRSAASSREWPNPGRFEQLIDLLERHQDVWIYISN